MLEFKKESERGFMNSFQFTSLNLKRIGADNKEHFNVLTHLNLDKKVHAYIPQKIQIKFGCLQSEDIYYSQFIVYDGEKPIGYLETSPLKRNKSFSFNYAVLPNCRHKGYGKKIVEETTRYVFDKGVNSVLLCVLPKNKYSIKAVLHAGFSILDPVEHVYVKKKEETRYLVNRG